MQVDINHESDLIAQKALRCKIDPESCDPAIWLLTGGLIMMETLFVTQEARYARLTLNTENEKLKYTINEKSTNTFVSIVSLTKVTV